VHAPDPDATPGSDLSFAARLARRFGAGVDPRIDLGSDAQAAAAGDGDHPPSTLERLGSRGAAATRYRVQREIARGGMGAILEVFDEDLRRRLAMKVILDRRTGGEANATDTVDPAVLARFLEEAQVTGQLDHPGIVPVHELGLDAAGRVYFTMRLVHGRDLEAIGDLVARGADGWSLPRALGVLQKVCEAMAYAHSKGVVHRDLKPANVMVGRFGEVYVMDWGLARVRGRAAGPLPRGMVGDATAVATDRRDGSSHGAHGPRRTDDPLLTTAGDVLGTPSYMPPEQAHGDLDAVDARADVYALGAMLYRLLAGAPPYVAAGERPTATAVWQRVRKGPPPPIEQRAPDAPAELHAVCRRAMARDAADRYPDMQALADDLRAFLEGRVVQAFDTGAWATARKWVQRNRALAASLAAAALALAGGLATSLVFASHAAANADAAVRQARVAQEVNTFLNDDLLAAIAPEHLGKDVTVRQVLDLAAARLTGRFATEPEIEAALRTTIGTSYERLGAYAPAHLHLERALALRRAFAGERSEPVLQALRSLAQAEARLGRHDAAVAHYEAALALAGELFGDEHRATLVTRNDLANELLAVGRPADARLHYEASLAGIERELGADAPDAVTARNNLALLAQREGRSAAAADDLRGVLAERQALYGDEHPETMVATMNLAVSLSETGAFDEAERLARHAVAVRRAQLDADHPVLLRSLGNLGTVLHRRGDLAGAAELFGEALAAQQRRPDADPADVLWLQHNLAATIVDPQRRAEVLALRQQIADGRTQLLGDDHPQTLEARTAQAQTLVELGRLDEAIALYRTTILRQQQVLGDDHPQTLVSRESLGGALLQKGDLAADEELLLDVLAIRRRVQGERHPDVAKTTHNLAIVRRARGDIAGAEATATEALDLAREAFGGGHVLVADCHRLLGDLALRGERWPAAAAAYTEALAIRRALGPAAPVSPSLLHQLGFAQYQCQDYTAAEANLAAALAGEQAARGPDARSTRSSLLQHARALWKLGRHAEAEAEALDLLARSQRADGETGDFVPRTRDLLVKILEAAGRPDDAAKWR
jgi:serine/threonine protein kinase